jgi:hypothetical protein
MKLFGFCYAGFIGEARQRLAFGRRLTFPLRALNTTSMKYLPLILPLLLAACGVPKMVKPGVPQQQYAQDHYQCLQESKSTYNWSLLGILGHSEASYDSTLYSSCMEARGYAKE